MILVFFINNIELFAVKTRYLGRVSFILLNLIGLAIFFFIYVKNLKKIDFFLKVILAFNLLIYELIYKATESEVVSYYLWIVSLIILTIENKIKNKFFLVGDKND